MSALDASVELLDRSLAYTRGTLVDVTDDRLARPTPCADWDLRRLLAHMEDALDAFTEAAGGTVDVAPRGPATTRVDVLREKACALLGAWTVAAPSAVAVGDTGLASPLLVGAAALEITVHGWDVGRATGGCARIPEDLARGLLPLAESLVEESDRGVRFAAVRRPPGGAPYDERLLGFLGRDQAAREGR